MKKELEFWWQKEERIAEEEKQNEKLNELDDNEMWCPCCGSNIDIMDDECSVCGC